MEIEHSEYCVLGTDMPLNICYAKKIILFPEMRVTKKIFTRAAAETF